jgi:hypothetical protein
MLVLAMWWQLAARVLPNIKNPKTGIKKLLFAELEISRKAKN